MDYTKEFEKRKKKILVITETGAGLNAEGVLKVTEMCGSSDTTILMGTYLNDAAFVCKLCTEPGVRIAAIVLVTRDEDGNSVFSIAESRRKLRQINDYLRKHKSDGTTFEVLKRCKEEIT